MVTPLPSEAAAIQPPLGMLMVLAVMTSVACLLVGLALWIAYGEAGSGSPLLNLGLLILMATPVLRVCVAAVEALRARDWFYFSTILAVVVLLALSVWYALMER